MTDQIIEAFRRRQFEDAKKLEAESDILELHPLGARPPPRYVARFKAKGLIEAPGGAIVEAEGCDVGIWLPNDYLRRVEAAQVLTYLGPHRRPFHPNIRPPFICVRLVPGMPLVDLLYVVFEMWTWHLYYTGDEGLNHAAAQWARRQAPSRFPIDRGQLKRRKLDIDVEPAGGEG